MAGRGPGLSPAGPRGPRRADLAGLRRWWAGLGGPRRGGQVDAVRGHRDLRRGAAPAVGITDDGELAAVRQDLAGRQALIADGHHRYAAYLRVQAARRAAGSGPGPWDFGLALLVDLHLTRPRSEPSTGCSAGWCSSGLEGLEQTTVARWQDELPGCSQGRCCSWTRRGRPECGRAAGRRGADRGVRRDGGRGSQPARWQALDTALLHEVLLPAWGVGEDSVSLSPRRRGCGAHGCPGRRGGGADGAGRRRGRAGAGRRRGPHAPQVDVLRSQAAQRFRLRTFAER